MLKNILFLLSIVAFIMQKVSKCGILTFMSMISHSVELSMKVLKPQGLVLAQMTVGLAFNILLLCMVIISREVTRG